MAVQQNISLHLMRAGLLDSAAPVAQASAAVGVHLAALHTLHPSVLSSVLAPILIC
jgi:hypothetical protein